MVFVADKRTRAVFQTDRYDAKKVVKRDGENAKGRQNRARRSVFADESERKRRRREHKTDEISAAVAHKELRRGTVQEQKADQRARERRQKAA